MVEKEQESHKTRSGNRVTGSERLICQADPEAGHMKRVVKAEVESKAEPMTDDHGADGRTAAELEPIGDNY